MVHEYHKKNAWKWPAPKASRAQSIVLTFFTSRTFSLLYRCSILNDVAASFRCRDCVQTFCGK